MGKRKGFYEPQPWETSNGRLHWTRLYDDLLDSTAYTYMSPEAKILYLYLKREYKGPFNEIKDTVILPYGQATKKVGIGRAKMNVCLYELEIYGFIEVKSNGGLYRTPNQYTFVSKWKHITVEQAVALKESAKEYGNKYRRAKDPVTAGPP